MNDKQRIAKLEAENKRLKKDVKRLRHDARHKDACTAKALANYLYYQHQYYVMRDDAYTYYNNWQDAEDDIFYYEFSG